MSVWEWYLAGALATFLLCAAHRRPGKTESEEFTASLIGAALWPMALLWVLGSWLGDIVRRSRP